MIESKAVTSLLEQRVQEGVKYLNKHIPDWRNQIDWDSFRFCRQDLCIAGQLGIYHSVGPIIRQTRGFDVPWEIYEEFNRDRIGFNPFTFMHNEWLKQRPIG